MKHKELVKELSVRLHWSQERVTEMLSATAALIGSRLAGGDSIHLEGLGQFEAQKKEERISVNPVDGKRYLEPPELVPVFAPDAAMQKKLKTLGENENDHKGNGRRAGRIDG